MKKIGAILVFILVTPLVSYAQRADAGPDKATCGNEVEIGNMDGNDPKNKDLCFHWKATPADPAVDGASTAKLKVKPKKKTVYKLTVTGKDFSSKTADEVTVFVFDKVELKEVSFTGNRDVVKDDGSGSYTAPHWKAGGKPSPVCYTAGETMKLSARIELEEAPDAAIKIKVKGTGNDGYNIDPATATPSGKTVELPATTVVKAFAATKVDFMEEFEMKWEISFDDGKSWCEAGSSKNQVYVTLAAPTGGVTLFHTVVHLGCKNAKGQTDPTALFAKVWGEFKDRDVRRVDGVRLQYYGNYTNVNITTATLLKAADGQCGSWTKLLLDVLKVHGIDNPNEYVIVRQAGGSGFFVKNWSFKGAGKSGVPALPYINIPIGTKATSYDWLYADVNDAAGIPGESNPNPASLFNNHQFIRFGGRFYDPSYGTEASSIAEMEANAIEAFYTFVPGAPVSESLLDTDLNGDGDKTDSFTLDVFLLNKNTSANELTAAFVDY